MDLASSETGSKWILLGLSSLRLVFQKVYHRKQLPNDLIQEGYNSLFGIFSCA